MVGGMGVRRTTMTASTASPLSPLSSSQCARARLDALRSWPSLMPLRRCPHKCDAKYGAGCRTAPLSFILCGCPPFALRSRDKFDLVAGAPTWRRLAFLALPKAGSFRSMHLLGNNNWHRDASACALAARPAGADAPLRGALLVRDPLARFLSGCREVASHHCSRWLAWRRTSGRPRLPVAAVERGKFESACVFLDTAAALRDDNATRREGWERRFVAKELLADVAKGFVDVHLLPAVSFLTEQAALNLTESLRSDWTRFANAAGLRFNASTIDGPIHNSRPADRLVDRHDDRFDAKGWTPSEWQIFCRFASADYACLGGYFLPHECQLAGG